MVNRTRFQQFHERTQFLLIVHAHKTSLGQMGIFGLIPGHEKSKTKQNHLSLIGFRGKRNLLYFGEYTCSPM